MHAQSSGLQQEVITVKPWFLEVCGTHMSFAVQVVNVLGFSLPFYRSPTLLLSLGLSVRVLYFLITQRPDIIHVSSPGLLVFAATLYAKLLAIPLVVRASCQALHL